MGRINKTDIINKNYSYTATGGPPVSLLLGNFKAPSGRVAKRHESARKQLW